jgi:Holliday junction resolvase RusA-like endonuclease
MMVLVSIPGPPFSQPRPRVRARGGFAQVYEPKEAKSWKGAAQVHMREAMREAKLQPMQGPLVVSIVAVFECPKSEHRKMPVPRRPYVGRKDWDNVAKATCDAGNGVLYLDDRQIAKAEVTCYVGAQGEAPGVHLIVRPW